MADNEEKSGTDVPMVAADEEAPAPAQFTNPQDLSQRLSGLMQNPEILAALQDKLGGMIGKQSGYIESLPKVVKRRLKALKKLQFDMIKIESAFYEQVHELECEYAEKYGPLFERRKDVVNGDVEPTDSDCDWPSDEEDDDDVKLAVDLTQKAVIADKAGGDAAQEEKKDEEEKGEEKPAGVPQFWLTIFKNVDLLAEMVQDHDEPILEHLQDVRVEFSKADPMGFTLHFIFTPNTFFTNTVLTKTYEMRSQPDETDPFGFEGPEIIKCTGCKIDWKKGQNVTVKLIKKIQKHQTSGSRRTVTKTVQNDSFFNFFAPPTVAEGEEPDEDTEAVLAADFEIGHFIRERVVPRAVLYFTGEALDDDDFNEDEEEEGDDDEEDGEEDEENDPDFAP